MTTLDTDKPQTAPTVTDQESSLKSRFSRFMDEWLIMPKILYFLLNIYVYAFHGILPSQLTREYHLDYYQFGFATSLVITNFFGAMYWTGLADRTGKYKQLIITSSILYTAVALLMLLPVGDIINKAVMHFKGDGAGVPNPSEYYKPYGIAYICVTFALFHFLLSAVFPLMDAQILGMMQKKKVNKDRFGAQRMYGAIGHFVATLCSFAIKKYKEPGQAIFQGIVSVIFIIFVIFGVENVTPVKHGHHAAAKKDKSQMTEKDAETTTVEIQASSEPPVVPEKPRHPAIRLLSDPNFMFFMLFVACAGIVRAITANFQKLAAENMCGKPETHGTLSAGGDEPFISRNVKVALMDVTRTISEVLCYLWAPWLKKHLGNYWIMILSQITGVARLFGYGIIPIKEDFDLLLYAAGCGLELLKGFSSGLISAAAIAIAHDMAPPGCEGTAQGLFSGNYSGLSMALGGLLGGLLLFIKHEPRNAFDDVAEFHLHQAQSAQFMFKVVSLITSIVTVLLMVKFIFFDRIMGLPGFPRKHSGYAK